MLFYDCKLTFKCSPRSQLAKVMKEKGKRYWGDEIVQDMNNALASDFEKEKLAMLIYCLQPEYLNIVLLSDLFKGLDSEQICQMIDQKLGKTFHITDLKSSSVKEVTAAQAKKFITVAQAASYVPYQCAWENGNLGYKYRDFDLDYFNNREFKVEEYLCPHKSISHRQAANEARKMLLDKSFFEELERIYAAENLHEFHGQPVHYKITANNSQTALQMANFFIEKAAKESCRNIFSISCSQADFGNGRFVRNLLEQAMLKQSLRIMEEYDGKSIRKKELSTLTKKDFEVNVMDLYKKKEKQIGFAM